MEHLGKIAGGRKPKKLGGGYGYAMAIGVVIFLFSFALSALVNKVTEREVLEY